MRWVGQNLGQIAELTWSHLELAVPAIVLSFLISVPIGWLGHRFRWSRWVLVTAASLLYALPSLPLLILLPSLLGTGVRDQANVIAALTLYGIALMVRSVADGLDSVPRATVLSAQALGYSPVGRFFAVELPLAGPVLLAGLRVVAVSTVALVTVSAVLGTPSLGLLFTDGLQRGITEEVLTGVLLTVLLALLVDYALVLLGRLLLPWTRAANPAATRRRTQQRVLERELVTVDQRVDGSTSDRSRLHDAGQAAGQGSAAR